MVASKYLNYTTPKYESTAKIKLADIHEGIANSNLFKDFDVVANSNKIGAEVELIKSEALLKKAISSLSLKTTIFRVGDIHKIELYNECPFIVEAEISNIKYFDKTFNLKITDKKNIELIFPNDQKIKGIIGETIKFNDANILISLNSSLLKAKPNLTINDNYEFVIHSENAILKEISDNLDIMAVDKDIPVIRINYKSVSPTKAANIVNALAAAYITDYIEEKYKSATIAEKFLDNQLVDYGKKLENSEQEIEQFRNENSIINFRLETETDLREISDLKKQLSSLEMSLSAIKDLNKYIKSGKDDFLSLAPNFEAFTDLLSTEIVKKIKELQREKLDLLTKYTKESDNIMVVDAKINDLKKYLIESIKNTENNLQIKRDELSLTIKNAEDKFIGLPTREKEMTSLERTFSLNEQIYRFLHEKRTEAEIQKAATISFHRIISEGEIPTEPISPNKSLIKVFLMFLGFLVSVSFIYLVHYLKGRVNDESSVYSISSTPILSSIPYLEKNKEKNFFFKKLVIEFDIKGLCKNGNLIVISSYLNSEGKSFNAIEMAKGLELIGKRVLLIETQNNPTLFTIETWENRIMDCKNNYDVIIVDNTPIENDPSAIIPMHLAGLNIMLLDIRITRKSVVTAADILKRELNLPNFQFIINRAGYTPSIFIELFSFIKKLVGKIKK